MGPYNFKADMLDPTQDNTWELDPSILQLNGPLYLLGTFYNGSQPNFTRPPSHPGTARGPRHGPASPPHPVDGERPPARPVVAVLRLGNRRRRGQRRRRSPAMQREDVHRVL